MKNVPLATGKTTLCESSTLELLTKYNRLL